MDTPIADAFAANRAVMPDAMELIRTLERQRRDALMLLALIGRTDAEAVASLAVLGIAADDSLGRQARELVEKYPLTSVNVIR